MVEFSFYTCFFLLNSLVQSLVIAGSNPTFLSPLKAIKTLSFYFNDQIQPKPSLDINISLIGNFGLHNHPNNSALSDLATVLALWPKLSLNQECTVSTSSKYQCTFITCVLLVCCVLVPHMYASGLNNSNKKSKPRSVQRPCNTVLSATFF